jgi:hypothetical protein
MIRKAVTVALIAAASGACSETRKRVRIVPQRSREIEILTLPGSYEADILRLVLGSPEKINSEPASP